MCLTCGKHNADRLWYLEAERHRIRSLGLWRDIVSDYLNGLVAVGLNLVKAKQPDYRGREMNRVSRDLLSWCARTLHGVQVLPDQDSAFKVIDLANELALMPCLCHKVMEEDAPPLRRCIAMNIAARIYRRDETKEDVQPISKADAKELIASWRARGAWQSVGWLWDANVIWLCNCDRYCVGHRAPEVDWGSVPSFVVATSAPDQCAGCRDCEPWCLHDALSFDELDRVQVDGARCLGCGLCVEQCSTGALTLEPRQRFYDVKRKRVVQLGDERVLLG